jgi:hypothetical protein
VGCSSFGAGIRGCGGAAYHGRLVCGARPDAGGMAPLRLVVQVRRCQARALLERLEPACLGSTRTHGFATGGRVRLQRIVGVFDEFSTVLPGAVTAVRQAVASAFHVGWVVSAGKRIVEN